MYSFCLMSVALHLAAQAARYQPAPGKGAAPVTDPR